MQRGHVGPRELPLVRQLPIRASAGELAGLPRALSHERLIGTREHERERVERLGLAREGDRLGQPPVDTKPVVQHEQVGQERGHTGTQVGRRYVEHRRMLELGQPLHELRKGVRLQAQDQPRVLGTVQHGASDLGCELDIVGPVGRDATVRDRQQDRTIGNLTLAPMIVVEVETPTHKCGAVAQRGQGLPRERAAAGARRAPDDHHRRSPGAFLHRLPQRLEQANIDIGLRHLHDPTRHRARATQEPPRRLGQRDEALAIQHVMIRDGRGRLGVEDLEQVLGLSQGMRCTGPGQPSGQRRLQWQRPIMLNGHTAPMLRELVGPRSWNLIEASPQLWLEFQECAAQIRLAQLRGRARTRHQLLLEKRRRLVSRERNLDRSRGRESVLGERTSTVEYGTQRRRGHGMEAVEIDERRADQHMVDAQGLTTQLGRGHRCEATPCYHLAVDGVTFKISEVDRGPLEPALDVDASVRSLLSKRAEAVHCDARRLVACDTHHPLGAAAKLAFYQHHPLVLRPDDVWFCIAQGFAAHVNLHAEALRDRFVRHAGKLRLLVEREDFVLGQPNPWPEVFAAFSEQIGAHVGKLRELVCARFSTSTPVEIAAFDVVLMDGFQGYFEYEMMLGCGIPQITLRGTPEDWAAMIPRVQHLAEYGLEDWTRELVPVLERLVATASGDIDVEFWRSFFRYQSGSGPAELTGWLLTLFPYLESRDHGLTPNTYFHGWHKRYIHASNRAEWTWRDIQGPSIGALPSGLASAPVRCLDRISGEAVDLRFVAGMFGVDQDPATGAVSPCFGWGVVHDGESAELEVAAKRDEAAAQYVDELCARGIARKIAEGLARRKFQRG